MDLAGWAQSWLAPQLEPYISKFDSSLLRVGPGLNRVSLNNVSVNVNQLNGLGLPFVVNHAFLQHVEIHFALAQLSSAPARVRLQGLHLSATLRETASVKDRLQQMLASTDAAASNAQTNAQAAQQQSSNERAPDRNLSGTLVSEVRDSDAAIPSVAQTGYAQTVVSMIHRLTKALHAELSDVHVEVHLTSRSAAGILGVTLGKASIDNPAENTSSTGAPKRLLLCKDVDVEGLGVYIAVHNPAEPSVSSIAAVFQACASSEAGQLGEALRQYLYSKLPHGPAEEGAHVEQYHGASTAEESSAGPAAAARDSVSSVRQARGMRRSMPAAASSSLLVGGQARGASTGPPRQLQADRATTLSQPYVPWLILPLSVHAHVKARDTGVPTPEILAELMQEQLQVDWAEQVLNVAPQSPSRSARGGVPSWQDFLDSPLVTLGQVWLSGTGQGKNRVPQPGPIRAWADARGIASHRLLMTHLDQAEQAAAGCKPRLLDMEVQMSPLLCRVTDSQLKCICKAADQMSVASSVPWPAHCEPSMLGAEAGLLGQVNDGGDGVTRRDPAEVYKLLWKDREKHSKEDGPTVEHALALRYLLECYWVSRGDALYIAQLRREVEADDKKQQGWAGWLVDKVMARTHPAEVAAALAQLRQAAGLTEEQHTSDVSTVPLQYLATSHVQGDPGLLVLGGRAWRMAPFVRVQLHAQRIGLAIIRKKAASPPRPEAAHGIPAVSPINSASMVAGSSGRGQEAGGSSAEGGTTTVTATATGTGTAVASQGHAALEADYRYGSSGQQQRGGSRRPAGSHPVGWDSSFQRDTLLAAMEVEGLDILLDLSSPELVAVDRSAVRQVAVARLEYARTRSSATSTSGLTPAAGVASPAPQRPMLSPLMDDSPPMGIHARMRVSDLTIVDTVTRPGHRHYLSQRLQGERDAAQPDEREGYVRSEDGDVTSARQPWHRGRRVSTVEEGDEEGDETEGAGEEAGQGHGQQWDRDDASSVLTEGSVLLDSEGQLREEWLQAAWHAATAGTESSEQGRRPILDLTVRMHDASAGSATIAVDGMLDQLQVNVSLALLQPLQHMLQPALAEFSTVAMPDTIGETGRSMGSTSISHRTVIVTTEELGTADSMVASAAGHSAASSLHHKPLFGFHVTLRLPLVLLPLDARARAKGTQGRRREPGSMGLELDLGSIKLSTPMSDTGQQRVCLVLDGLCLQHLGSMSRGGRGTGTLPDCSTGHGSRHKAQEVSPYILHPLTLQLEAQLGAEGSSTTAGRVIPFVTPMDLSALQLFLAIPGVHATLSTRTYRVCLALADVLAAQMDTGVQHTGPVQAPAAARPPPQAPAPALLPCHVGLPSCAWVQDSILAAFPVPSPAVGMKIHAHVRLGQLTATLCASREDCAGASRQHVLPCAGMGGASWRGLPWSQLAGGTRPILALEMQSLIADGMMGEEGDVNCQVSMHRLYVHDASRASIAGHMRCTPTSSPGTRGHPEQFCTLVALHPVDMAVAVVEATPYDRQPCLLLSARIPSPSLHERASTAGAQGQGPVLLDLQLGEAAACINRDTLREIRRWSLVQYQEEVPLSRAMRVMQARARRYAHTVRTLQQQTAQESSRPEQTVSEATHALAPEAAPVATSASLSQSLLAVAMVRMGGLSFILNSEVSSTATQEEQVNQGNAQQQAGGEEHAIPPVQLESLASRAADAADVEAVVPDLLLQGHAQHQQQRQAGDQQQVRMLNGSSKELVDRLNWGYGSASSSSARLLYCGPLALVQVGQIGVEAQVWRDTTALHARVQDVQVHNCGIPPTRRALAWSSTLLALPAQTQGDGCSVLEARRRALAACAVRPPSVSLAPPVDGLSSLQAYRGMHTCQAQPLGLKGTASGVRSCALAVSAMVGNCIAGGAAVSAYVGPLGAHVWLPGLLDIVAHMSDVTLQSGDPQSQPEPVEEGSSTQPPTISEPTTEAQADVGLERAGRESPLPYIYLFVDKLVATVHPYPMQAEAVASQVRPALVQLVLDGVAVGTAAVADTTTSDTTSLPLSRDRVQYDVFDRLQLFSPWLPSHSASDRAAATALWTVDRQEGRAYAAQQPSTGQMDGLFSKLQLQVLPLSVLTSEEEVLAECVGLVLSASMKEDGTVPLNVSATVLPLTASLTQKQLACVQAVFAPVSPVPAPSSYVSHAVTMDLLPAWPRGHTVRKPRAMAGAQPATGDANEATTGSSDDGRFGTATRYDAPPSAASAALFSTFAVSVHSVGVLLVLGDVPVPARAHAATLITALQRAGHSVATPGQPGSSGSYSSRSFQPLCAASILGLELRGQTHRDTSTAAQLSVESILAVDARRAHKMRTHVQPSYRTLLQLCAPPALGNDATEEGSADAAGHPFSLSLHYAVPSDQHAAQAQPAPLTPAEVVELTLLAREEPSRVRPDHPTSASLSLTGVLRDVRVLPSPLLATLALWAASIPVEAEHGQEVRHLLDKYHALDEAGVTTESEARDKQKKGEQEEQGEEGHRGQGMQQVLPDPRFNRKATTGLVRLPPVIEVAIDFKILGPAIILLRDPSSRGSDGLGITLDVCLTAQADSAGYVQVQAEVQRLRGMRVMQARRARGEAGKRLPLPSPSGSMGHQEADEEHEWRGAEVGDERQGAKDSSTTIPTLAPKNGRRGTAAALTLPGVADHDYLRPVSLTASFTMLPARSLPSHPLPLDLPSFMALRLCTVDDLLLRAGYRDVLLVQQALQALTVATTGDVRGQGQGEGEDSVEATMKKRAEENSHRAVEAARQQQGLPERTKVSTAGGEHADLESRTVHVARQTTDSTAADPAQLSLSASVSIPTVVVLVVNDLGELEVPLLALTVSDVRASALGYHASGRLLASLGLSVDADFFDMSKFLYEPLIEHWSIKAYLLKAEPLRATACATLGREGGDLTRHPHVDMGVGGASSTDRRADPRLAQGHALYAYEDSVNGMVPLDFTVTEHAQGVGHPPCMTVEGRGSEVRMVDTALESQGSSERPGRTARAVRRVKRWLGEDNKERAEEQSRALQSHLRLSHPPAVPGAALPPPIDVNALPSDLLIRVVAKKPLQINVTGTFLNSVMDSYASLLRAMSAQGQGGGPHEHDGWLGGGGTASVYINNACGAPVYWVDSEGMDDAQLHGLQGVQHAMDEQKLLFFPLRTQVSTTVMHGSTSSSGGMPLCSLQPLGLSPAWRGVLCAGSVLAYVARKDAWFRWYAALTGSGDLLLWDKEPRPEEEEGEQGSSSSCPAWLARTCVRRVSLLRQQEEEYRVSSGTCGERLRPVSPYILQVTKGLRVTLQDSLPVHQMQQPVLTLCLASEGELSAWCAAVRQAGVPLRGSNQAGEVAMEGRQPGSARTLPSNGLLSIAQRVRAMTSASAAMALRSPPPSDRRMSPPAARLGRERGSDDGLDYPADGTTARGGMWTLRPDHQARTIAPVASEEGSACSQVLQRARLVRRTAQERARSARRAPVLRLSLTRSTPDATSHSPPSSWLIPTDRVATHFIPGANPWSVRDPQTLLGTSLALLHTVHAKPDPSELSSAAHRLGQGVVADVTFEQGRKIVVVRSTVAVQNCAAVPLLAQFEDGQGQVVARRRLGPGQTVYAPLQAAASGRVSFAPLIPGYECSRWCPSCMRARTGSSGTGLGVGGTASCTHRAAGSPAGTAFPVDKRYVEDLTAEAGTPSLLPSEQASDAPATDAGGSAGRARGAPGRDSEKVRYGGGEDTALPLPIHVPLAVLTPYALSAPVSLVDDAADQQHHREKRSFLRTLLTGPANVPTTTLGAALPISSTAGRSATSGGDEEEEEMMYSSLPTYFAAAHVVRPPRSAFRRPATEANLASLLSSVTSVLPLGSGGKKGNGSAGGGAEGEGEDGVYLQADPATGFITEVREDVDLSVARKPQDKFTTVLSVLPCLVLENLLPYPVSFRVLPSILPMERRTRSGGLPPTVDGSGRGQPEGVGRGASRKGKKGLVSSSGSEYGDGAGREEEGECSAILACTLQPGDRKQLLFVRQDVAQQQGAAHTTTSTASAMPPLSIAARIEAGGYRELGWSSITRGEREEALVPREGKTVPAADAAAGGGRSKAGGEREYLPHGLVYGLDGDSEARAGDHSLLHIGASAEAVRRTSLGKVKLRPLHLRLERVFAGEGLGVTAAAGGDESILAKFGRSAGEEAPDPDTLRLADARRRAVSLHLRLVAPYWIINRTDLPIAAVGARSKTVWAGTSAASLLQPAHAQVAVLSPPPMSTQAEAPRPAAPARVGTGRGSEEPSPMFGPAQPWAAQDAGMQDSTSDEQPHVHIELLGDVPEEHKSGANPTVLLTHDMHGPSAWSSTPIGLSQTGTTQSTLIPVRGKGKKSSTRAQTSLLPHLDPFLSADVEQSSERQLYARLSRQAGEKVEPHLAVGAYVELGEGRFARSRMITLAPRFLLVNQSGLALSWRQAEGEGITDPLLPIYTLQFPGPGADGPPDATRSSHVPAPGVPSLQNGTSGSTGDMAWMPVHWADARGQQAVQFTLAGSRGRIRHMADLTLVGVGSGHDSRDEGRAGAQGQEGWQWAWSAPLRLVDGESSMKLRRILRGNHLPARVVWPDVVSREGSGTQEEPPSERTARSGVSTDQVTWLRVGVVTLQCTTYINVARHPALLPPQLRQVAFRIDNHTSMYRVQVRQRGRGPACVEQMPAYGTHDVAPRPWAPDDPAKIGAGLMLHVRPVGVAELCYWDGGRIGRLLKKRDFSSAAHALIMSALPGAEAPVRLMDRHNDAWGCWAWRDGAGQVNVEAVGAESKIMLGGDGSGGAVRRSAVSVHVYADSTTGPTKVIHVTDAPAGSEEAAGPERASASSAGPAVDFLLQCIRQLQRYEAAGQSLLSEVLRVKSRMATGGQLTQQQVTAHERSRSTLASSVRRPLSASPPPTRPTAAPTGSPVPRSGPTPIDGHARSRSAWSGVAGAADAAARFLLGPSGLGLAGEPGGSSSAEPVLWVQVACGVSLPVADVTGSSDPFVEVALELCPPGGPVDHVSSHEQEHGAAAQAGLSGWCASMASSMRRTTTPSPGAHVQVLGRMTTGVCRATLDPVWNDEHVFRLPPHVPSLMKEQGYRLRLRCTVMDYDLHSASDTLGLVLAPIALPTVPSAGSPNSHIEDVWYPLQYVRGCEKRATGSVRIRHLYTEDITRARVNVAEIHARHALEDTQMLKGRMLARLSSLVSRLGPTKGGISHEAEDTTGAGPGAAHLHTHTDARTDHAAAQSRSPILAPVQDAVSASRATGASMMTADETGEHRAVPASAQQADQDAQAAGLTRDPVAVQQEEASQRGDVQGVGGIGQLLGEASAVLTETLAGSASRQPVPRKGKEGVAAHDDGSKTGAGGSSKSSGAAGTSDSTAGSRAASAVDPSLAELNRTRGRVVGHQLECTIVEAHNVAPALLQAMRERLVSLGSHDGNGGILSVQSLTGSTGGSAGASPGRPERERKGRRDAHSRKRSNFSIGRGQTSARTSIGHGEHDASVPLSARAYCVLRCGAVLRRTLPAPIVLTLRFTGRPIGLVFAPSESAQGIEAALSKKKLLIEAGRGGSDLTMSSDASSTAAAPPFNALGLAVTDTTGAVAAGTEEVDEGLSSVAVGRPVRFVLKESSPESSVVKLVAITQAQASAACHPEDGQLLWWLQQVLSQQAGTGVSVRLLSAGSLSCCCLTWQDASATLSQALQQEGAVTITLGLSLTQVPAANLQPGLLPPLPMHRGQAPLHASYAQVTDFGDRVPMPRPSPSKVAQHFTVAQQQQGAAESGADAVADLGYSHVLAFVPAAPSAAAASRGSATPGETPNYMSLSVFARAQDDADEFAVSGGELVGQSSTLPTGPWGGTGKEEDLGGRGIFRQAAGAVQAALEGGVAAGKGLGGIALSGGKAVGGVMVRAVRARKEDGAGAEEGADLTSDPRALQHHAPDAASCPLSTFLQDYEGLGARSELPSGAMSLDDALVAHIDFIPIPPQGSTLDTWLVLQPQGNTHTPPERTGMPRVRIKAQWVPLYASKAALRSVRVQLSLAGLAVSLVDFEPKELLYLSLSDVHADLSMWHTGKTDIAAGIGKLQVANAVPGALHPMLLSSMGAGSAGGSDAGAGDMSKGKGAGKDATGESEQRSKRAATQAALARARPDDLSINLRLQNHPVVLYVEELAVRLAQQSVQVDDSLAFELLRFVASLHLTALLGGGAAQDSRAVLQSMDDVDARRKQKAALQQSSSGDTSPDQGHGRGTGRGRRAQASAHSLQQGEHVEGRHRVSQSRAVLDYTTGQLQGEGSPESDGIVPAGCRVGSVGPGDSVLLSSDHLLAVLQGSSPYNSRENGGAHTPAVASMLLPAGTRSRLEQNSRAHALAHALHDAGWLPGAEARKALFARKTLQHKNTPLDPTSLEGSMKLYFGRLLLGPVALDLTFTLSDPALLAKLLPDFGLLAVAKVGLESAGTALANIEHAPIQLDPMLSRHTFETPAALGQRLVMHYIQTAIYEWYKILGSASFLGNPLGLVRGVSRDAVGLIYNPAQDLLEDPAVALAVFGRSALTLAQTTTVGLLDSATQIANSASKAVKAVHYEDNAGGEQGASRFYQPPITLFDGLRQGTRRFGGSLLSAVRGLATDPVLGARKGGLLGATKGVGSALIGMASKPLAGALDGIVLALQGASAAANPSGGAASRPRLPRWLGSDGRLLSYSPREAEGAARLWLLQVKDEKARTEQYVYHAYVTAVVHLKPADVFDTETRARAGKDGVVACATGLGADSMQERIALRKEGKYCSALDRLRAERVAGNGPLREDPRRSEGVQAASEQTGACFKQGKPAKIDYGRHTVLGIPVPQALKRRQPPVLRTAARQRSAGCTAPELDKPEPFVLLVTDKSLYLLRSYNNDMVWTAPLNHAGLLLRSDPSLALRVVRGAAATAGMTAGGVLSAAGTIVSAAGTAAATVGRPVYRAASYTVQQLPRMSASRGTRSRSMSHAHMGAPAAGAQQAGAQTAETPAQPVDTHPPPEINQQQPALPSSASYLRLLTPALDGATVTCASHVLKTGAKVMLFDSTHTAAMVYQSIEASVAGEDCRLRLVEGEESNKRAAGAGKHTAGEREASEKTASQLLVLAVEAHALTTMLRMHHVEVVVDDVGAPAMSSALSLPLGLPPGHSAHPSGHPSAVRAPIHTRTLSADGEPIFQIRTYAAGPGDGLAPAEHVPVDDVLTRQPMAAHTVTVGQELQQLYARVPTSWSIQQAGQASGELPGSASDPLPPLPSLDALRHISDAEHLEQLRREVQASLQALRYALQVESLLQLNRDVRAIDREDFQELREWFLWATGLVEVPVVHRQRRTWTDASGPWAPPTTQGDTSIPRSGHWDTRRPVLTSTTAVQLTTEAVQMSVNPMHM